MDNDQRMSRSRGRSALLSALTSIGLLSVLFVLPAAAADLVTVMTPARIEEAVALAKEYKGEASTTIVVNQSLGSIADGFCGRFSTPFSRAVLVADKAVRAGREPSRQAMARESRGQVIVTIDSSWKTVPGSVVGKVPVWAEAVVVASDGRPDATIVRPSKVTYKTEEYPSWVRPPGTGGRLSAETGNPIGVGMTASFPLSAFTDGREVRVSYKEGPECRTILDMKGVR
jgi:hypothetical protein